MIHKIKVNGLILRLKDHGRIGCCKWVSYYHKILTCVYLNRIFVRNEKVRKQYFHKLYSVVVPYKWSKNTVVKDVV